MHTVRAYIRGPMDAVIKFKFKFKVKIRQRDTFCRRVRVSFVYLVCGAVFFEMCPRRSTAIALLHVVTAECGTFLASRHTQQGPVASRFGVCTQRPCLSIICSWYYLVLLVKRNLGRRKRGPHRSLEALQGSRSQ